jgi:hypothetical protein
MASNIVHYAHRPERARKKKAQPALPGSDYR